MRRKSTQIELSWNSTQIKASFHQDDTTTEYYSTSGESSPVSLSQRRSIAGCEFLDEEDEMSESSESPYNLKSVEEELRQIELDSHANRMKDGQAAKSSWVRSAFTYIT